MADDLMNESLLTTAARLDERAGSTSSNNAALIDPGERLRRLLDRLPVTVYSAIPDPSGSHFFLQGNLEKLTGYPNKRFLEDPSLYRGIIHPDDRPFVNSGVASALQRKKMVDLQYRIITRDGTVKWIRDRATPIYSGERLWRVDGVMEDITQSRRDHEAVKEASKRWQNTFDAMREALMVLDKDFRVLQCNQAMRNLLNKPEEEILGLHCWELVHGTDNPIGNCPCPKVLESLNRESSILKINDRYQEVAVYPQFNDTGEINAFIHIMTDITEHLQAEAASREAHQTLLTVLDSIEATIYVVDLRSHEILFMNRHMKEVYEGDFTGRTCWKALYDLDRPCGNCTHLSSTSQNEGRNEVCVWEGHNPASNRWYLNYDRLIKWVDGRMVRLQVATDITEIKNMEYERLHTEARLRQAQKMEAIGTLAGGIAHDFNNILSAIMGYSELALDDALNGTVSEAYLRQVLKAGHRARELVQQILTFSRQSESEAKPIQVQPIVKEALKLLRASLPSTIEIQQEVENSAIVEADPTQIHQIIMNLCANAGHAMRLEGGVLRVSLVQENLGLEFTSHHQGMIPGPHLKLVVADTGHGIATEIMDKIFDPYFTTKEKGEGTGMGLAMIQGIARSCKGTVTVENAQPSGAVFTVYLPVVQEEAFHRAEMEKIVPGGDERILFVDDEPPLADLGKHLLERQGYHVTICTSSAEALALFESRPDDFDLVITDMTMPHMTGEIMARKMMTIRPRIPVVICTGYSEKITPELIDRLGIRGLVMKPLVGNELTLAVRQALDESG